MLDEVAEWRWGVVCDWMVSCVEFSRMVVVVVVGCWGEGLRHGCKKVRGRKEYSVNAAAFETARIRIRIPVR